MMLAVLKMPIRNRFRYRKWHGNGNRMIRGSYEILRNIGPMEAAISNNRTTPGIKNPLSILLSIMMMIMIDIDDDISS